MNQRYCKTASALAVATMVLFVLLPFSVTHLQAGIIGNETAYTSEPGWNGPESYALVHADHFYVAGSGETVDSIYVYVQRWNVDEEQIYIGVYDISGGLPDNRVGRVQVSTAGADPLWIGADVDWPLTAGDTFCVAFETLPGAVVGFPYGSLSNGLSNDDGSVLPDPWTHDGYSSFSIGCYAVTSSSGAPTGKPSGRRSRILLGVSK